MTQNSSQTMVYMRESLVGSRSSSKELMLIGDSVSFMAPRVFMVEIDETFSIPILLLMIWGRRLLSHYKKSKKSHHNDCSSATIRAARHAIVRRLVDKQSRHTASTLRVAEWSFLWLLVETGLDENPFWTPLSLSRLPLLLLRLAVVAEATLLLAPHLRCLNLSDTLSHQSLTENKSRVVRWQLHPHLGSS